MDSDTVDEIDQLEQDDALVDAVTTCKDASVTPEQQPHSDDTPAQPVESAADRLILRLAKCATQTGGTDLDLSNLSMRSIPLDALTQFPMLKRLNVRRNELTALPDELPQQLPHLTLLNASDNALTALPESIGALRSLQRLLLENNRCTTLPTSVSKLQALEELNVRSNALETLDDNLGAHLQQLTTLLLGGNAALRAIPQSFETISTLRVVDLTGIHELASVPEKLRRLHERHVILHSRTKRRELITRALRVRSAVAQTMSTSALMGKK